MSKHDEVWQQMYGDGLLLAALVSVNGRGRSDLLQAATGILSPYVVGRSMGDTKETKEPDKTYSRPRTEYKENEAVGDFS